MRLVVLMLFVCGLALCNDEESRFHYHECVRVTHGFYRGCYGRTMNMHGDSYEVNLVCPQGDGMILEFESKYLAPKKDKTCGDN